MKDKKDLLGLLGLFTLISLLVSYYFYFQPKIALSQQTQKYTTFKTENEGFKFLRKTMTNLDLAPIFAQTPTTTSPATQVATKEYVDRNNVTENARSFYAFAKDQTTVVLAHRLVGVVPYYKHFGRDVGYGIKFIGLGFEGILYKNCTIPPYFSCISEVTLLNPFEFNTWRQALPELKSIAYKVTLRGSLGGFEIDFCQNLTGDLKLYWNVISAVDWGSGWPPSDYSKLRFAVDREAYPGMAFIYVWGPFGYTVSCSPFFYQYSTLPKI